MNALTLFLLFVAAMIDHAYALAFILFFTGVFKALTS